MLFLQQDFNVKDVPYLFIFPIKILYISESLVCLKVMFLIASTSSYAKVKHTGFTQSSNIQFLGQNFFGRFS